MHTARHPRFNRPYDQCIYQPMVEVLRYLRATNSKRLLSPAAASSSCGPGSKGLTAFRREQVVGSSGVVKYEWNDGKPMLVKEPKVEFIDDGPGKPVGINRFIGRHPIFAFGNSDGDHADASMDNQRPAKRTSASTWPHRPPHRRRARIRLRSPFGRRQTRQSARRRAQRRLDRRQHEERLEGNISARRKREAMNVLGGLEPELRRVAAHLFNPFVCKRRACRRPRHSNPSRPRFANTRTSNRTAGSARTLAATTSR